MYIFKVKHTKQNKQRAKLVAIGTEYILLFAFWVLISGHHQLEYLLIGIGASALVTFLTNDILFDPKGNRESSLSVKYVLSCIWRFINYIPWLVWAIIKANVQVALIILNPRMPIAPGFITFKTKLTKKTSLVTLANSITLTPGTITVDLKGDTYIVHAIVPEAASDLESGIMQNKAGTIFHDCTDPVPIPSWIYSGKETAE